MIKKASSKPSSEQAALEAVDRPPHVRRSSPAEPSPPRTSPRPSIPRKVLTVAALTAAVLGFGAVKAPPASAAASVGYCFVYSTGASYRLQPVQLQLWLNGQWQTVLTGTAGANGCGSFYTAPLPNYYFRVRAEQRIVTNGIVRTVWSGNTPYYAPPGYQGWHLGTGVVSCTAVTMSCGW